MIELQSLAALLGILATTVAAAGAYRTLGRMEGQIGRWGHRLDDHSGQLKDHDKMFLEIAHMPTSMGEVKKRIGRVESKLNAIMVNMNIEVGEKNDGSGDG